MLDLFKQSFLGQCKGVGLFPRGSNNDNHVCFAILTEDDGNWFQSDKGSTSSFWLPELIIQLQAAEKWCQDNCTRDKWGYYFKD